MFASAALNGKSEGTPKSTDELKRPGQTASRAMLEGPENTAHNATLTRPPLSKVPRTRPRPHIRVYSAQVYTTIIRIALSYLPMGVSLVSLVSERLGPG